MLDAAVDTSRLPIRNYCRRAKHRCRQLEKQQNCFQTHVICSTKPGQCACTEWSMRNMPWAAKYSFWAPSWGRWACIHAEQKRVPDQGHVITDSIWFKLIATNSWSSTGSLLRSAASAAVGGSSPSFSRRRRAVGRASESRRRPRSWERSARRRYAMGFTLIDDVRGTGL